MIGIAYAEGWQDYTPSYYFKPIAGVVTLVLSAKCVKDFVNGDLVGTLPEGFRPASTIQMPATVLSETADVTLSVGSNGNLILFDKNHQGSLEIFTANITFLSAL
ncbi:hypothetical protein [Harryflintia acetispora]|uniref:hypothetical protein n=1 Tax=Harryflintia acetispora TaxID=1849041 RepID=UPI0018980062|nr:hypothetical protein [Harryflintia acetispora]